MEDCTLVKVDSVNKQGLLLEVVQVLTDLNLTISKSYISSDAGWFMDVFHVKDEHGRKLRDQKLINSIQQAIGTTREIPSPPKEKAYINDVFEASHPSEHTAIEMSGTDRPGLFSEISAVLADLHCNVVEAHAWSHNARLACIAYVSDRSTDAPINDPQRLASIQDHLSTVLSATTATPSCSTGDPKACNQQVKTGGFQGGEGITTCVERRLHQLMLSGRDFDSPASSPETETSGSDSDEEWKKTAVTIENCAQKGYSIVSIECRDRPRLMFDAVCTLTDMQYVIFHASIYSRDGDAFQEYFIRHTDGYALNADSEKERVVKCLVAAIERRVCEGVKLKLYAENRTGLLSDITRFLRENGLVVVRADIETQGEKTMNAFYVRDISGNEVDMEFVKSIKKEMGSNIIDLEVRKDTRSRPGEGTRGRPHFSFGDRLKSQIGRFSHNIVAIK